MPLLCSEEFAKGKIKLVGEGPEYCKNPRTVMEKAKIQLNEMIERVAIQFDNLNKVWIYPKDQSFWKYSDVHTSRTFGSCYTFFIPDSFERPIPINNLRFRMKSNVSWMVHSLGSINRKENYQYNISEYNLQKYKINFEVYHMLDYNNYICKNEPYYDKDSCTDNLVFKESMEKFNCTLPFLQNKCHICNEQHSVTMVQPFAKNLTKGSRCENPCSYIKAAGIPIQQRKSDYNLLLFFFPESIRVHKAYYAYDELSLIAEIGGYVGLFLGWSFYQVIDVIEFSVESLKRKF